MTEDEGKALLACFVPALPPASELFVLARLHEIAADYLRNAKHRVRFVSPPRLVAETDEAYLGRVNALSAQPRKRGRPRELAAGLLLFDLREILQEHGCNAGVPKERNRVCHPAELAELIDRAVGGPCKGVHWRGLAERVNEPIWAMEIFFNQGAFSLSKEDRKDFNGMLRQATVKPQKRKKENP